VSRIVVSLAEVLELQTNPGELLGAGLILLAVAASFIFWLVLIFDQNYRNTVRQSLSRGADPLPPAPSDVGDSGFGPESEPTDSDPAPRSDFQVAPLAYAIAIGWIILMLGMKLLSYLPQSTNPEAAPVTLSVGQLALGLSLEICLQLLITLTLAATIATSATPPNWKRPRFSQELVWGLCGFLAAVGPVLAVMLLTTSFRTEETEHEMLKLLRSIDAPLIISLICLMAVVGAPISEELTYRVALLGGMERNLGRTGALIASSTVFAAVHGFPDMLGLLPLSFILSWIYQQTRSYIAVVTTHALFNAFNLAVVLMQTWAQ
jgi:membrane protease YdiL (CAAX protease family)